MKNIRDLEIRGKRVLIRVDFNVPMDAQGRIADDIRIRKVLPTLRYGLEQGAGLILCSHMGRPKGRPAEEYSLAPAAAGLSRLLGREVRLAPDCVGEEVKEMVARLAPGEVLLLENLRFHAEEEKNDPGFAEQLAELADVYINDAFAVSHRAHASVVGVTKFVAQCGAGFLLQKEMDYFHQSISEPVRPLVAIVGGAKVSSKLGALRNMLHKVDKMVIGGAMANTFLKSMGMAVGNSKVEEDLLDTAREFLAAAGEQGVSLYLPVDCVVADAFDARAVSKQVPVQEIPAKWLALDIGPATVTLFIEALADARTIVWNGPMGAFEMDAFARGTMAMAQAVANSHALSITGGGDSNAAIKKAGVADNISYMSTGGGAFLMLLEGKELPGVKVL